MTNIERTCLVFAFALFFGSAACSNGPDSDGLYYGDGNECSADIECTDGQTCYAPEQSLPCGVNPGYDCQPECASGMFCVLSGCEYTCVPGCSVSGCGARDECDAQSDRCVPVSCTDRGMCPDQMSCAPNAEGADAYGCARKSCKVDADCDGGVCWRSECHSTGARCDYTPA